MGAATPLVETLAAHERAWNTRPLIRRLYLDWFRQIAGSTSSVSGLSVELGSGIGRLREAMPDVVLTDVEPTPWSSLVVRAEELPFADGELANLVLIDVFHHIGHPARFLDEAVRVLRTGGRIVILDPYCSPVSGALYRRFHDERTDLAADPFDVDARVDAAPFESNQARATLAFFRALPELEARWPSLAVVERRRLALLAYPLSGGFTRHPLIPPWLGAALQRVEPMLTWAAPALAFRCLVVLERAA